MRINQTAVEIQYDTDLTFNKIGNDGAKALVQALQFNTTLQNLYLSNR